MNGHLGAVLEGRRPLLGVFRLVMRMNLMDMGQTTHRTHSPSTRRTS